MKDHVWIVEVRVKGGAWFPLVAASADTRAEARENAGGLRGHVQTRVRKYVRAA
jgi:hypothetical protein